jgi:hypothetical protein
LPIFHYPKDGLRHQMLLLSKTSGGLRRSEVSGFRNGGDEVEHAARRVKNRTPGALIGSVSPIAYRETGSDAHMKRLMADNLPPPAALGACMR